MKFLKIIITASILISLSSISQAHESVKKVTLGQTLHDDKCLACHTTDVYTRENHTIKNKEALGIRVGQCMNPAKAEWNDIEKDMVTKYIGENFYKF